MKNDTITGAKILNRDEILLILNISSSKFNRLMNRDGNAIQMPIQRGLNGFWWANRAELIAWKQAYDEAQREAAQSMYSRPRLTSPHMRPANSSYITRTPRGAIVVGLNAVPTEGK